MTTPSVPSHEGPARVILIGSSGLIGRAIARRLRAEPARYELVGLGRRTQPPIDLEDRHSIDAALEALAPFDHLVVAAGQAEFAALAELDGSSFALGLRSKLMGQVDATLAALPRMRRGGSVILTSGALSHHPTRGSAPAALVNGAIDAFVRAIAHELDDDRRINAVSPGWITDTLIALGRDPAGGVSAAAVAELYVDLLQSDAHGTIARARADAPLGR